MYVLQWKASYSGMEIKKRLTHHPSFSDSLSDIENLNLRCGYKITHSLRFMPKPRVSRLSSSAICRSGDVDGRPGLLLIIHVWPDALCYYVCRLAKLSEGQVIDGRLECLYHGWQFEGEGQCVKIPQVLLILDLISSIYTKLLYVHMNAGMYVCTNVWRYVCIVCMCAYLQVTKQA
jgi:hypothetical protein